MENKQLTEKERRKILSQIFDRIEGTFDTSETGDQIVKRNRKVTSFT